MYICDIYLCERISFIIYLNRKAHMGARDIFEIYKHKPKSRCVPCQFQLKLIKLNSLVNEKNRKTAEILIALLFIYLFQCQGRENVVELRALWKFNKLLI